MCFSVFSLRRLLAERAEPDYARFSASLLPAGALPVWGVRIPTLRGWAREWGRGDWRSALLAIAVDSSLEEALLRGFIVGYARMDMQERLQWIERLLPEMKGWSICDSCTATFKDLARHRPAVWQWLHSLELASSGDEFRQRFLAVCMMDYFLTDEYVERVLDELAAIRPVGHYAAMGVAWALSVCYIRYPRLTLQCLRSSSLDDETRRMAVVKICESRRVTSVVKKSLKSILQ